MAKLSQEDLLAQFEEMTLIELSEFVKAFEEKFDVTAAAAAPVVVAGGGAAAGGAEAPEELRTRGVAAVVRALRMPGYHLVDAWELIGRMQADGAGA